MNPDFEIQAAAAYRELAPKIPHILARHDLDRVVALLDAVAPERPYHYLSDELRIIFADISKGFGNTGFGSFQRALMLHLIARFTVRSANTRYAQSILDCFSRSFQRILRLIGDPSYESYNSPTDLLMKDLGLCRQKLFPAGARLVEPRSGFHRTLLFRGGPRQALRLLALLARCGGNKPYFGFHTHLSELEDFNAEGHDRCYCRIAEMLELHPDIRGVWGGSWFYDPQLASVSPHLGYIHERLRKYGAEFFFSGVDVNSGALSRSKTRREAYERGAYVPKTYVMVWPRDRVLAWAKRFGCSAVQDGGVRR